MRVRLIRMSISASHHMLRQPAAPAPMAIARTEMKPMTGLRPAGASISPVNAVKTTSDMTRGLSNAK